MATLFPRVYRSFAEFERFELRRLDGVHGSVDHMVDEMLAREIEEESEAREPNNGILFDMIEE